MQRSRCGFTIVELMIVVVFLGIVATLLIPMMTHPTAEARRAVLLRQLQAINAQIDMYRTAHGDAFPTSHSTDPMGAGMAKNGWGVLVSESYLKEEPRNVYTGSTRLGEGALEVAVAEASPGEHGWYYQESDDALSVFIAGYDPVTTRFSNEMP